MSEWEGKTPEEIKAEISRLIKSVMDRANVEAPYLRLATRLGFAVGQNWRLVADALRGARTWDPNAFIKWDRDGRCYSVVWSRVLPGKIQELEVSGTLHA